MNADQPPTSHIVVCLDSSTVDAARRALAACPEWCRTASPALVIVARDLGVLQADSTVSAVIDVLSLNQSAVTVIRPPGAVGAAAALVRERWTDAPLPPGARRFEDARLPRRLLRGDRVLVAALPRPGTAFARPTDVLAQFAHPRQRAAAAAETADTGAVAELAVPIAPRVIVLEGQIEGTPAVVVTSNLGAAELVWSATAALGDDVDGPVPWQTPVVQRLVELDAGIAHPDLLRLTILSDEPDHALNRSAHLPQRLAELLGLSRLGDRAV